MYLFLNTGENGKTSLRILVTLLTQFFPISAYPHHSNMLLSDFYKITYLTSALSLNLAFNFPRPKFPPQTLKTALQLDLVADEVKNKFQSPRNNSSYGSESQLAEQ
jgi:hypothetical protein